MLTLSRWDVFLEETTPSFGLPYQELPRSRQSIGVTCQFSCPVFFDPLKAIRSLTLLLRTISKVPLVGSSPKSMNSLILVS